MLKNHLVTAARNFWRNKVFSTINVLGLSIGISAALVIFLIVYYEFSFDRFEKDEDRIYRVVIDAKFNGTEGHSSGVQAPLANAVVNEVTGIDETVPVMQFQSDATAKVAVTRHTPANPLVFKKQPGVVFTNEQYFLLVNYKWIAGSQQLALKEPFSVVLTEARAQQYFPDVAPAEIVGKTITYNDNLTATVSGIVQDLKDPSVFTAAEFISYATIAKTALQKDFMMNVWNDWMAYSQLYLKLSPGNTPERTARQLKDILTKYNKDFNNDGANSVSFHLQPLNDIHFNPLYPGVNQRIANRQTLYGLLAIAAFLLLLGCINFINLTTAQGSQRAKEIGIRKAMGSSGKQLLMQFLSETFFITTMATLLSVALTPLLLQVFKTFIPPGLNVDLLHQPSFIVFLVLLTVVVSFLSGFYPSMILAGYKPVLVLKNQAFTASAGTRSEWIRKGLTVSQFVIAQFFVIATMMVSKQINYALNADMGFSKHAVVNFDLPRRSDPSAGKRLIDDIRSLPGVSLASTGFFAPADEGVAFTNISFLGNHNNVNPQVNTQIRWGNPDYIKVYQIKLLAGRNVQPSDTIKEFLVNESYAHAMGFKRVEDALNKFLQWNGKAFPVVGVMKDFHDQSVRAHISPIVFGGANGSTFHIRLKPNNTNGTRWQTTIEEMQQLYRQAYPEEEFNYKFLDDTVAGFYESEQNTARLLKWATALAVFISCLGLLGLVIYTTNLRRKEIGIRKVLGASVAQIVYNLSKGFVRLVAVAFVIAVPVAWWAAYTWLQDFAFRTSMSWWVFLVSGSGMLLLALSTLSIQTIRAALANPVESLRSE